MFAYFYYFVVGSQLDSGYSAPWQPANQQKNLLFYLYIANFKLLCLQIKFSSSSIVNDNLMYPARGNDAGLRYFETPE